ncbi:hypothetical protein [Nostoc foliaceum]|nr:hypothetical protein [Nostoc foliaceum]
MRTLINFFATQRWRKRHYTLHPTPKSLMNIGFADILVSFWIAT